MLKPKKEIFSIKPSVAGVSVDVRELASRIPPNYRLIVVAAIGWALVIVSAGYTIIDRYGIFWSSPSSIAERRDALEITVADQAREIDRLINELRAARTLSSGVNIAPPSAIVIAPGGSVDGLTLHNNIVRGGSLLNNQGSLKNGEALGNDIDMNQKR